MEEKQHKEELPDGKVRTTDGKIIDRVNACTHLIKHPQSDNLFRDRSGTQYVKSNNGGLRRYPPKAKQSKKQRLKNRKAQAGTE